MFTQLFPKITIIIINGIKGVHTFIHTYITPNKGRVNDG